MDGEDEVQKINEEYEEQKQNQFEEETLVKNYQSIYEAYEQQKEQNQQRIQEYILSRGQEIVRSNDQEIIDSQKQKLFNELDKKITYQMSHKNKTIKFPKKIESHYDFDSAKEEIKYKKIMPIDVKFPSQPHDIQLDMMYKIISGLDNAKGENILVEAPSGTGKTRAVLSACLSFLQKHRDINDKGYRYQILYVSNTQDQLQQVANEIKKSHVNLRCRVMATQEQMCINSNIIKKNKLPSQFGLLCQHSCSKKQCMAKDNSKNNLEQITRQKSLIDIEEIGSMMQNFDNEISTCPYFDFENTADQQDVILAPYNLIFDQSQIKRLGSIQRRLLVIFDEGHNVIEEACKGSTYELKINTLNSVLDVCQELEKNIKDRREYIYQQHNHKKQILDLEIQRKQLQLEIQDSEKNKLELNELLNEFSQPMDEESQQKRDQLSQILYKIKETQRLLRQTQNNFTNELQKCHQYHLEYTKLADSYEQIIKKLFSQSQNEINLIVLLENLKGLIDYIKENEYFDLITIFEEVQFFFHQLLMTVKKQPQNYKLMAQYEVTQLEKKIEKDVTFKLQCFEPRQAFQRLLKFPQSHFILLSSTLSPFSTFKKEFLSIKEQTEQNSNPTYFQIIQLMKNNFFVEFQILIESYMQKLKPKIKKGSVTGINQCKSQQPGQIKIENRNNESTRDGKKNDNKVNDEQEEFQLFNEIGFQLENLIAKIPEGVIIVLPNMKILQNIKKAWLEGSKYGEILNKKKKLFFQPTKKAKFAEVIQQYKEEIESNKNGILLAVSNNNFLDSFQIKDSLCRALFIIGKPYLDQNHGNIQEKMNYIKNNGEDQKQWYNSYCTRKINKLIGMVISNKNDYGCVYLIDKVNNEKTQIQQQFSKWIKKKTDFSNNLDDLVQETEQFFQQKFEPSVCIEIDQQILQEQIQENELIQNDQFDGHEDDDFI